MNLPNKLTQHYVCVVPFNISARNEAGVTIGQAHDSQENTATQLLLLLLFVPPIFYDSGHRLRARDERRRENTHTHTLHQLTFAMLRLQYQ